MKILLSSNLINAEFGYCLSCRVGICRRALFGVGVENGGCEVGAPL